MKNTPSQCQAIESDSRSILVVAGPGSGKTQTTVNRITRLLKDGEDPRKMVVLTFTNAAAREIEIRIAFNDARLGYVGTLHGFALKMLKEHGEAIGYGRRISIVGEDVIAEMLESKAKLLGCKLPIKKLLKLKSANLMQAKTTKSANRLSLDQMVIKSYYADLREGGMVDFDSILSEFYRMVALDSGSNLLDPETLIPENIYKYLFVDEVQDSAAIDWAIYHLLPMTYKFFVGDQDQCQPGDTMVRMADGSQKPISEIFAGDQVVSYDRHGKVFIKKATVTEIKGRSYCGNMLTVSAGGISSRCTPNHRWMVKWTKSGPKWCTYLMRKGGNFRVGKTMFLRSGGTGQSILGLPLRMRQEGADQGWVLKTFDTEGEATADEQITAANYGLPEACFKAATHHVHFSQKILDTIFSSIPNQLAKASRCLYDNGRELEHPLFDVKQPRTRRTVQEIHACNLIDGVMAIPIMPHAYNSKNRAGNWHTVSVTKEYSHEAVYSLNVDRYHKYVADGLVTCNSIYSFRGGRPDLMKVGGAEVILLEDNFRSHSEICEAAQLLIENNDNRIPKVTRSVNGAGGRIQVMGPAINAGQEMAQIVTIIRGQMTAIEDGLEIAVLARTNDVCYEIKKQLKASNLPVASDVRSDLPKDWKLAKAAVEMMVNPENDTIAYFFLMAKCESEGGSGFGSLTKKMCGQMKRIAQSKMVSLNQHAQIFPLSKYTIYDVGESMSGHGVSRESVIRADEIANRLSPGSGMLELAMEMGRDQGDDPQQDQGVTVSTLHSAKGREWDTVIIAGFEDEYLPGTREGEVEESRRLAYVGITRARKNLYLTHSTTRLTSWGATESHKISRFVEEMA